MGEKSPKPGRKGYTPKGGRGNVWEPSDEQRQAVKWLTAAGGTHEQIAQILMVKRETLEKRCPDELKHTREVADLGLIGKLYRKAMGSGIHSTDGDTAVLIYLAKVRLGLWDRPPLVPAPHPNDVNLQRHEELCVKVEYRYSNDPLALAPPPPDRLPQQIEATATQAD